MPIYKGSQGWSAETQRKQDDFRYLVRTHLSIVREIRKKHSWNTPYVYVDLTAGSGEANPDGVPGSPLIFCEEAEYSGVPWLAWMCEKDQDNACELIERLEEQGFHHRCQVLMTDHREVALQIAAATARLGQCLGLIYADPNATWLPVELIADLTSLRCFQRADVLCYVAAAAYKRFRCYWPTKPHLRDHLLSMGKREIHVREPHGNWQWSFAFLTNWKGYPEAKKLGVYDIKGQRGAAIMEKLDLTTKERSGQQGLEL